MYGFVDWLYDNGVDNDKWSHLTVPQKQKLVDEYNFECGNVNEPSTLEHLIS